jgi:phosphosulfolactate synthase (CoM biosynthesis protein A)
MLEQGNPFIEEVSKGGMIVYEEKGVKHDEAKQRRRAKMARTSGT